MAEGPGPGDGEEERVILLDEVRHRASGPHWTETPGASFDAVRRAHEADMLDWVRAVRSDLVMLLDVVDAAVEHAGRLTPKGNHTCASAGLRAALAPLMSPITASRTDNP